MMQICVDSILLVALWSAPGNHDFERLLERGQAALSSGRFDEAQQVFKQAAVTQPLDARSFVLIARTLVAKADETPVENEEQWVEIEKLYLQAEVELRKAIDLDRDSQEAWKTLGRTLLRLGRVEESIATLYHALGLGESSPELLVDLADAVLLARVAALESGNHSEAESRLGEAVNLLYQAEAALRVHGRVLERLGDALAEKGELHRSLSMYRRAICLEPQLEKLHESHLSIVERLPEEGKLDELQHCVDFYHGLVEQPALAAWYQARAHTLKGHVVYNKVQDFAQAANEYLLAEGQLIESTRLNETYRPAAEPWLPALRTYRGHALMEAGKLDAAETAFLSALDRQSGYEPALKGLTDLIDRYWTSIGGENASAEQFTQIKNLASRVCLVNPGDYAAWNNFGFFARESKSYEESYQAYRRALALAPDNPRVLNDTALILIYHLQRDLDCAEVWLKQALQITEERLAKSEDQLGKGENREDDRSVHGDAIVNLIVMHNAFFTKQAAGEWFRKLEQAYPDREETDHWRKQLFPDEARVLAEETAARKAANEPESADGAQPPDTSEAQSADPEGDQEAAEGIGRS